MIVKELDPFSDTADPLLRAGRAAEEQMAFYLRRAFGSAEDVRVFHSLRLEHAGDAAQIDHLVLHRWGMILLESKSVTTRVRVNAQGEWMRWHASCWHGMPSPTLQVERQAAFLRARLREHAEELLGKVLGLQVRFGSMPLDTFVAISDQGIIERLKGTLPQVCKADQIAGQITTLMEMYRKANSPLGLLMGKDRYFWHTFKAEEMTRMMQYLRHSHRPSLRDLSREAAFACSPDSPPIVLPAPTSSPLPLPAGRVPSSEPEATRGGVAQAACTLCGKAVSVGVAQYCREHSARFGGQVYCMACQRRKPA